MNASINPALVAQSMAVPVQVGVGIVSLVVIAVLLLVLARWVIWPLFKGIGWVIGGIFTFIGREIRDALRLAGALIATAVYVPLIAGTILIGRWSATRHFGQSLKNEVGIAGACIYRLAAANLLKSFGMRDVVAGLEERVPQALAEAPGTDAPRAKTGRFEGYTIVGSLPGGGSGAKLYIAEPDAIRTATFERNGFFSVGQVVIKVFSLRDGSSLPQIVRESRALDAAKKLGLVLDHELTPERFFYVMRYVPGQSLTAVTHQLHAASGAAEGRGLDDASMRRALSFMRDLLATLDAYHRGGLWHKDVKPDNIIVEGERAHLVDFGLVTPLRSAMTLTTHGTEYFRDPEMVKMAMKGAKVHEVDGAKFDVYGAGAVLYSIVENSFPAHGVLSQITMRCPEALRWVVRRAMTKYDERYPTAAAMLRDVEAIRLAADPMAVKPGQLPSMQEGETPDIPEAEPMPDFGARVRQAASPLPPPLPATPAAPRVEPAAAGGVGNGASPGFAAARPSRPEVRIRSWLTGEFEVLNAARAAEAAVAGDAAGEAAPRQARHVGVRRSAREQIESARARATAARARVQAKLAGRGLSGRMYSNNPNAGAYVAVGSVLFLTLIIFGGVFTTRAVRRDVASNFASDRAAPPADAEPTFVIPAVQVPPSAPVATADGQRILVIVDLKKPLSEDHQAQIRECVDRLERAGFEMSGDYPGSDVGRDELDETAAVIKAAEGLSVESEAGRASVGRWMAEHSDASIVLWFKPLASTGKNVVLQRVLIPASGVEEREGVKDAMETAAMTLR